MTGRKTVYKVQMKITCISEKIMYLLISVWEFHMYFMNTCYKLCCLFSAIFHTNFIQTSLKIWMVFAKFIMSCHSEGGGGGGGGTGGRRLPVDSPHKGPVMLCFDVSCAVSLNKLSNRWLSARLQYLQCVSNGDTAVLHWAIEMMCLVSGDLRHHAAHVISS